MTYSELLEQSAAELRRPFIWQMPGCGLHGKTALFNGAAQAVGKEVRTLTSEKVLLVIGEHTLLRDAGKVVCRSLEQAEIEYDIFSGIYPEPHLDAAERISEVMDKEIYGAVVGVGGGSVMDIAKLAVHAGDGKLMERIQKNEFAVPRMPLVLLPTTSGTGSEISPYVVLTIEGQKRFFRSPGFLPALALIDPLATATMPVKTTAATAFDAMTHGLEGAVGRPSPYTECLGAESTALILKYLPEAVKDGTDMEARYYLALASLMGMMSYTIGGGLYAHSISYILTLEKGLPHGAGCGLALPYTLALNVSYISSLLDKMCIHCLHKAGTEKSRREMIDSIQKLYIRTGLPPSLKKLGYKAGDAPELAEKLFFEYYRANNPREISKDEAQTLFQAMISGEIQYF